MKDDQGVEGLIGETEAQGEGVTGIYNDQRGKV